MQCPLFLFLLSLPFFLSTFLLEAEIGAREGVGRSEIKEAGSLDLAARGCWSYALTYIQVCTPVPAAHSALGPGSPHRTPCKSRDQPERKGERKKHDSGGLLPGMPRGRRAVCVSASTPRKNSESPSATILISSALLPTNLPAA